MSEGVNDTAVVLIPKINNPEHLNIRPVSLCNVIYKIVSKCLVNRLRPVMSDLIDDTQSAFVPGRMITNNVMIVFECIHTLQRSKDGKGKFCAYKLDLAKAYDRVDWGFLQGIMKKLGFNDKWTQWIMKCVTTVKYRVSFDGHLLESFCPTRGLRQGDPLSPFLFLLVAEGLSTLIRNAIQQGNLKDLRICRRALGISHLLFADDSLLFFWASADHAQVIKRILSTYQVATGQLLGPAKCSLMMGNACDQHEENIVKHILQIQSAAFDEKYLGLPVPDGCMKAGNFQTIREKFLKRLSDWAEKYLSLAGKVVLIKTVLQGPSSICYGSFQVSSRPL